MFGGFGFIICSDLLDAVNGPIFFIATMLYFIEVKSLILRRVCLKGNPINSERVKRPDVGGTSGCDVTSASASVPKPSMYLFAYIQTFHKKNRLKIRL